MTADSRMSESCFFYLTSLVMLGNHGGAPTKYSLPDVVHRFKTMTSKKYTDGVKQNGWQPFPAKLWQRNYYEHIIRNEETYLKIAEYIQTNPQRWTEDVYHV